MKKLTGESLDLVQQNIETLKRLFPEIVREGKIDFDALRSVLGEEVDDSKEKYDFTWAGKQKAIRRAQQVSTGTLRPCPEESVNWDTTKNLYIEGDNLEVLRILQQTYYNKVKMIYIDPPYNTGNDFVYNDDFAETAADYVARTGQALQSNPETNGRFHSNWLNMMYPRLRLARNLLREDGVIFISIDDNENANLRKICDEIFGEENFVAQIIWERAYAPVNLKKHFSENHDYALCFAKDKDQLVCNGLRRSQEADDRYMNPDNDPRGVWQSSDFSVGPVIPEKVYEIVTPSGRRILPPEGRCWLLTKERYEEYLADNRIWFGKDGNNVPRVKRFLSEVKSSITPLTIWKYTEVGHSQDANRMLKKLFDGAQFFDYPKSVDLIKRMVELYTDKDSIILDFFSGSATTAHAVMQMNAEDGGHRRHFQVQIPEPCQPESDAAKAGLQNICEVGKERIRRAGALINRETQANIDYGFKVFRLDTSNLNEWDPETTDIASQLALKAHGIKQDRTPLDLVYEIMLKYGIDLVHPISKKELAGKSYYDVGLGALLVCLDSDIDENFVRKLAQLKPQRVVFADASFRDDNAKLNAMQILRHHGVTDVRSL